MTLARQKGSYMRLPRNLKEMSKSRNSRLELETEVYIQCCRRGDNLKLRISFAWFSATFRSVFKGQGETIHSPGKIIGFLKRRGISLQGVKDKKKRTVAERIHLVRDQLIRYDDHQRRPARDSTGVCPIWGRTPPSKHWAMDEYCISMSVETRKLC